MDPETSFWQRWLKRPQQVWLRRAMFQIHLWTGIGIGLYVVVVGLSGSAVVFRNEVYQSASAPKTVPVLEKRLSGDELRDTARRMYSGYNVEFVWEGKKPNQPTEIWMLRDGKRKQRLFDPYTGADLGDSIPRGIQWMSWFMDLHTNLLTGKTGRVVNGIGSIVLTLMCISGAVIWWPGVKSWKRSLLIDLKSNWKRLNWDLHSAIGAWSFLLVFMWAATGVFLVFPLPFQKAVNRFSPLIQYQLFDSSDAVPLAPQILAQADGSANNFPNGARSRRGPRPPIRRSKGDIFLRWLYYLHFGNFAGWKTKALWTALGLIPPILFVTGAIMWWNRVLSPAARRSRAAVT